VIPRILIVDSDPQYARWLRHHVETIWTDADPDCRDHVQFEAQLGSLAGNFDLILLGAHFAALPESPCEGFDWLRRLRKRAGLPPVVFIATGGSELAAVKALRLGATDYLPRDLVTAPLLEARLRSALLRHQRRSRRRHRKHARREPRGASPEQLRSLIPGYALIRPIGESSRAAVWLARSEALGNTVALKISKPAAGTNHDQQLFAREYSALGALRHPAVVDIYDYGVHEHREYLAMEYFPCGDLKQRLLHPITPAQAVGYVRRIAAALQAVHGAGLMHRDLKPPNIMLRADCAIVLIDFGLARRVDSTTSNTEVGVLRGSPYYMSPEQVRGLVLDQRSDLYSLGVIFFEMLSGRKPYVGTTAMELMEQHVAGQRTALAPELQRYEALLAPLMAPERDDRFPDAGALLEAIDMLQPAEQTHAG